MPKASDRGPGDRPPASPENPSPKIAVLALASAALFWAGAFPAARVTVQYGPPLLVAFVRYALAAAVLGLGLTVSGRARGGLQLRDLPRQAVWAGVWLGAVGVFGYNAFFFSGVRLAPASDGAMIIPTLTPALTAVIAGLWLKEKLTQTQRLTIAASAIGQVLIFSEVIRNADSDGGRLLGDLLFALAATCWAGYGVLSRRATRLGLTPMWANAVALSVGAGMFIPFTLRAFGQVDWPSLGVAFWGPMIYQSVFATVLAFVFWSSGVDRLGAARAGMFLNLVPVFSLGASALWLGERPSPVRLTGTALVIGVLVWSSLRTLSETSAATNGPRAVPRAERLRRNAPG